jgi:serine/threonine-protein kinase
MSDWLQKLELLPPPVEPQYQREEVNSPRSFNPPKEPEAAKQKPKVRRRTSPYYILAKLKDIPWVWLIGVFLFYGISGYILGVNPAPWLVVAGALAGSLAGALAWVVAVDRAAAWVGVWAGGGALVWVWAGAVAGYLVGALIGFAFTAMSVFVVGILARDELLKYFSRFHSFLILTGTSLSGLGSGWLLGFLLQPKG